MQKQSALHQNFPGYSENLPDCPETFRTIWCGFYVSAVYYTTPPSVDQSVVVSNLRSLEAFASLIWQKKSAALVSTTTSANRNPKCKPVEFVNHLVCFFGQSITTAMILNIHWVSLVLQCFLLIDCKAKQVANIVDKCARFVMGKTSWSVCFGFLIYKCRKWPCKPSCSTIWAFQKKVFF